MFKHYNNMKTITITDEAYERLKRMKGEDDSFTDAILKIPEKKVIAKDLLGILKGDNIEVERKRLKEIHRQLGKDMEEKLRAPRSR